MKKNIGKPDKVLRILLAAVLIMLNITRVTGKPESLLSWFVAVVLIITSLIGHCPVYELFGINTRTWKRTV